jgi:hemerythrin
MTKVEWADEYDTGIESIDNQNREFVRMLGASMLISHRQARPMFAWITHSPPA